MNKPIKLFDDWAKKNKDKGMEKGHSKSVDFMISEIVDRLESPFTFIDFGCGNGWVVRKIGKIENCISAMGIDGAKKMIEKAVKTDQINKYVCADLVKWIPKNPVDVILSMEVLYYLENPQKIINRIYNSWLNINGTLIFGIDHYAENKPSLNWSEECGVNMNTKTIIFWLDIVKKAGFKNVNWWQVGQKGDWCGTLVIRADK